MADDTTNPDSSIPGEDPAGTPPAEPQATVPTDATDALPAEPVSDATPAAPPAESQAAVPADATDALPAESAVLVAETVPTELETATDADPAPPAAATNSTGAAPPADVAPVVDGTASNMIDQAELDALAGQLSGLTDKASTPPLPPATDADPPVMDDAIAQAMAEAIAAEAAAAPTGEAPAGAEPAVVGATTVRVSAEQAREFTAPELPAAEAESATSIDMLDDVQLDVKIELGRTNMYIEDVLKLGAGAVVELDKLAGDPVDIYVNDRLIARGEVLVLNDNFCVRINAIHSPVGELERT